MIPFILYILDDNEQTHLDIQSLRKILGRLYSLLD